MNLKKNLKELKNLQRFKDFKVIKIIYITFKNSIELSIALDWPVAYLSAHELEEESTVMKRVEVLRKKKERKSLKKKKGKRSRTVTTELPRFNQHLSG